MKQTDTGTGTETGTDTDTGIGACAGAGTGTSTGTGALTGGAQIGAEAGARTSGGTAPREAAGQEVPPADCVLCGEPTEYPASTRGATLCPVCEWQEAQRTACSG